MVQFRVITMSPKSHESRVKFVYFRDKLRMMQNVSLVERSVDVWTTSRRQSIRLIINNIIIDY